MVGVPDTRNHLGARRRGTALGPGEAEHQAGGHAGLTEGRVAVGILGAEAELEAGARVGAPDLGDGGEAAEGLGGAGRGGRVARVVDGECLGGRDGARDGAAGYSGRRSRRRRRLGVGEGGGGRR